MQAAACRMHAGMDQYGGRAPIQLGISGSKTGSPRKRPDVARRAVPRHRGLKAVERKLELGDGTVDVRDRQHREGAEAPREAFGQLGAELIAAPRERTRGAVVAEMHAGKGDGQDRCAMPWASIVSSASSGSPFDASTRCGYRPASACRAPELRRHMRVHVDAMHRRSARPHHAALRGVHALGVARGNAPVVHAPGRPFPVVGPADAVALRRLRRLPRCTRSPGRTARRSSRTRCCPDRGGPVPQVHA